MTHNATIAEATLAHLLGLGVREFLVCAGARNVPLVASLLQIEDEHDLQIRHHFDERTASFFAMGRAKKERSPVAVVTTSGTAVAELLPSAIEAHYSGVPLVLVTADRPPDFRGSGAPQAIEQLKLFGDYATKQIDVTAVTDLSWVLSWDRRGPLHLNVCFEEPRSEDTVSKVTAVELPSPEDQVDSEDGVRLEAFVADPKSLVVVLGELPEHWRKPVEHFLGQLQVPFWAEGTSGLREVSELVSFQVPLEKNIRELSPRKVLRIGGVPSLRFWRDLETHKEIEVLSISSQPFSGLARPSRHLAVSEFPTPPELAHSGAIQQGQVADSTLLNEVVFSAEPADKAFREHPKSEPAMMRDLSERISEKALVFLGNSLPIREWNLAASYVQPHPQVFASRGANGIDGQLATFLGMSVGEQESWGVFGDLTLLYDLNAPAILEQLPPAKRRIVVINNGGGRIFSRLPSMAGLDPKEKKVTENRHEVSFSSWAAMWGLDYVSWRAGHPFPEGLPDQVVLEVFPEEDATEEFWRAWK